MKRKQKTAQELEAVLRSIITTAKATEEEAGRRIDTIIKTATTALKS